MNEVDTAFSDPLKLVGRTVAHFRITAAIATGAMGTVYRAEDTRLHRLVALKFPLPEHRLARDARERFLREARSAGALDHPNVCSIHEAGETDDGHLFLVMPLYEGETLKARLARAGALPVAEAVRITNQIASGLSAAHAAGIVHRDLKPANIMLLPDGTVKILDFGLAKVRDLTLTASSDRLGTAAYMAPEQIDGRPVDRRTDLWALGVVLYEMLTGKRPFEGDDAISVAHAIVHREPVRPSALRVDTRGLDDVVFKLLRKDPTERYASAEVVASALAGPYQPAADGAVLPFGKRITGFWTELSRRRVLRVAAVYLGTAWLLIEVTTATFPYLGLPDWLITAVIVLLALCFPLAVILAWAFDITPHGIERATALLAAAPAAERRRRIVRYAWAPVLLLALASAAWLVSRRANNGDVAAALTDVDPAGRAVVVLPFRATGDDAEFWREGIVDLLSFNLEGIGELRKIDPQAALTTYRRVSGTGAAAESAVALEVARQTGATYAITGNAVRHGDAVRLTAQVYDTESSSLRGSAMIDGPADSVHTLVDRLTLALIRLDALPVTGELPPVNISRVTTASLPALRAYLDGELKYRRGRYKDAVTDFRRAVDLDSTFARAFFRLANAYTWDNDHDLAHEYFERAAHFTDGLPERDVLLLKAGASESWPLLEKLTLKYPDDVDGWFMLGDLAFHWGGIALHPATVFRSTLERAVAQAPHYFEAYTHLIEDAFMQLDSGRARQLIDDAERFHPACCAGYRVAYDLAWRDRTSARTTLDSLNVDNLFRGWVALAVAPDALERMEQLDLTRMVNSTDFEEAGNALWRSLQARVMRGQLQDARRILAQAEGLPVIRTEAARFMVALQLTEFTDMATLRRAAQVLAGDTVLESVFWLGALAVAEQRWADVDRAVSVLDQHPHLAATREHVASDSDDVAAPAAALRAYAALRRGDWSKLEEFKVALSALSPYGLLGWVEGAHLRYEVGRMLLDRGKLDEAERYLNTFYQYDWFYFVQAQYFLAQIHEARGRHAEARSHYERVVFWWSDSDPEFHEWRGRAVQALARLRVEPN
jgi:tetratricopeptide (TPR) repeat protein/tRNA A-37 threonylcarbamoyl transferase component Bud32